MPQKVAWAVGRQLSAIGFNWIHSPSSTPTPIRTTLNRHAQLRRDSRSRHSRGPRGLKGFKKAGIINTATLPGRGESSQDAHSGLPVINEPASFMRKVHLAPFQAMIEPACHIMSAHTAYPTSTSDAPVALQGYPHRHPSRRNGLQRLRYQRRHHHGRHRAGVRGSGRLHRGGQRGQRPSAGA